MTDIFERFIAYEVRIVNYYEAWTDEGTVIQPFIQDIKSFDRSDEAQQYALQQTMATGIVHYIAAIYK